MPAKKHVKSGHENESNYRPARMADQMPELIPGELKSLDRKGSCKKRKGAQIKLKLETTQSSSDQENRLLCLKLKIKNWF